MLTISRLNQREVSARQFEELPSRPDSNLFSSSSYSYYLLSQWYGYHVHHKWY